MSSSEHNKNPGGSLPVLAPVLQTWLFLVSLSLPAHFLPFLRKNKNWNSGQCPLCQLAKSLEGRCSISDITTKISPSWLRRPLLCPFP